MVKISETKTSKMISKNITDVLQVIAKNLEYADINWVVIASCALALQSLDVDPVDIDIMTDEFGLFKINRALLNYKIVLSDSTPSPIFDSTMSKFCIDNCSIEVMSNFKIKSRSNDMWHNMNDLLKHRNMITIGDVTIPVLPLSQSIKMYTLMGRDKDMIKIEKIKQHLTKVQMQITL